MPGAFFQLRETELPAFTRRENEILALLAEHLSDGEIAARLSVGINTVKWYVRQISEKLGTHNRRQAVQRALTLGWPGPVYEQKPDLTHEGAARLEGQNKVVGLDYLAAYNPLTGRETEVLLLIAQGKSNQQIAEEIVLSVGTVKWYSQQIYQKLGVGSRTQAVAKAREIHILE